MVDIPYPNGLAACMARAGFTDPRLADAAGTTKQQIHKLRHGERKLTVQWAKRLAPHLGCTWQELIEGPDEPADPQRAGLLTLYDSMDPRDRATLVRVAQGLLPLGPQDEPPAQPRPLTKSRDSPQRSIRGGADKKKRPVRSAAV